VVIPKAHALAKGRVRHHPPASAQARRTGNRDHIAHPSRLPDNIKAGKPMRVRNPDTRDRLADEFLRATGADIREGHGEAYYVPSHDFISLAAFAGFKGADHFYNVAFHELAHWTGAKSRLDRDLKHRFGAREYAAEELVALSGQSGPGLSGQSAATQHVL
jgi:antirestriction protein ArdC